MIVGLQGSARRPLMKSLQDGFRNMEPSAGGFDGRVPTCGAEQLAQVAKAVGTAIWPGTGTDKPLEL